MDFPAKAGGPPRNKNMNIIKKKKKKYLRSIFAAAVLFSMFFAAAVLADEGLVPCGGPGQKACTICDFFELTRRVTNYIIFAVIPAMSALMLFFGGIYMIWTRGNPDALKHAKTILGVSVTGMVIIMSGWVFINTFFMSMGIAEWDGFNLKDSWWKISAKCSLEKKTAGECNDRKLQENELCDPSASVDAHIDKYGWTKERAELIVSKCSPKTCTANWCGDGKVTGKEDCDPNETQEDCVKRLEANTNTESEDECKKISMYHMCTEECELLPYAPCEEDALRNKIGSGCWLSDSKDDCRRGKYECDTLTNKVICKILEDINDECCLDGGQRLGTDSSLKFDIIRGSSVQRKSNCMDICKMMLGKNCSEVCKDFPPGKQVDCSKFCSKFEGLYSDRTGMASCQNICAMRSSPSSSTFTCDDVCASVEKVCIGVGLTNVAQNKCISIINHDGESCDLSGNQTSNNCHAIYRINSFAPCCEKNTCKDNYAPCCSNGGVLFTVGETACYCR